MSPEGFPFEHWLPEGWRVFVTAAGYFKGTNDVLSTPECTSKWQARWWVYRVLSLPVPPPVQREG